MDQFGIGNTIMAMINVYYESARGTGRTSLLIDNLRSGDRVVFMNAKEAKRVQRLCMDKGIKIEIIITDPRTPERIFERGRSKARTFFDHGFIEQYYIYLIERAQDILDRLQKDNSTSSEDLNEQAKIHVEYKKPARQRVRFIY